MTNSVKEMGDSLLKVHIVKTTADVVHIRFDPGGWIVAVFDESTGCVFVQSDWGSAGHRWVPENTGIKGDDRIKRFFATAGINYIIDKFSYDCESLKSVIDAEKTRDNLREHVLDHRRDWSWDKEKAREVWDEIDLYYDDLEECDGKQNMNNNRWYDAVGRHVDDLYEYASTRKSLMCESFEEIVIPAIQRWLVDQGYRR